jgi:hypothetical protein
MQSQESSTPLEDMEEKFLEFENGYPIQDQLIPYALRAVAHELRELNLTAKKALEVYILNP